MRTSVIPQQWRQSKSKSTIFDSFSRKQVLSLLQHIDNGCIQVSENNQIYTLGNPDSDIVADIQILNPSFYRMVLLHGSTGAGEAYMAGCWSSSDVTKVVRVICRNMSLLQRMEGGVARLYFWLDKYFHKLAPNSLKGSKKNIVAHYDLSNDLYATFLDDKRIYSAAIFNKDDETLEQAQENKLARICNELQLQASDHIVEIGTGWGGLAIYMAETFGCQVTTTTISDAQYEYTCEQVKQKNLTHKITVLNQDYRKLTGQFDKLVSIEMIEAVGHAYFKIFFQTCNALVKPGGRMLLQAITIPEQRYQYAKNNVDFIQRYIFPGGCLPSLEVMLQHMRQHTEMKVENVLDIGIDYAETLKHWHQRFQENDDTITALGFDDIFKRMWVFYLNYCEGGFRERAISTVQVSFYK